MQRYDATIRRAKKERQPTLFTVSFPLEGPHEFEAFGKFMLDLEAARKDPFAITPEVKAKTEAAMKFDELVPPDVPKYVTADEPPGVDLPETFPTEDEAVEAFKKFAATHKSEESVKLVQSFNVARVKELKPEQRARFIAEASRGT